MIYWCIYLESIQYYQKSSHSEQKSNPRLRHTKYITIKTIALQVLSTLFFAQWRFRYFRFNIFFIHFELKRLTYNDSLILILFVFFFSVRASETNIHTKSLLRSVNDDDNFLHIYTQYSLFIMGGLQYNIDRNWRGRLHGPLGYKP